MWLVKVSVSSSQKNDTPSPKAHQERQAAEFARIYPVCCSATKDVRCTYILEMNVVDFQSWVQHRDRERRQHIPEVDKIVPFVQVSPAGRSRADISKAIDLDRDTLSATLAAFVQAGLLTVRTDGGIEFFQARSVAAR